MPKRNVIFKKYHISVCFVYQLRSGTECHISHHRPHWLMIFFVNSIPKHLPIDCIEMRIEAQIHTPELSMIESNGRVYVYCGRGGFSERMSIKREREREKGPHHSNKSSLVLHNTP